MRIHIRQDVLKEDLAGEAVLLDVKSGTYYRLNGTAQLAWPQLVETGNPDDALRVLQEKFSDIPEERLREDLDKFVEMLVSHGLADRLDSQED